MLSCAFFGHSDLHYDKYVDKIREIIVDLINKGVTVFYNGFRGNFDVICARIVSELKKQYPHIKNLLVLSYYPTQKLDLPKYFDESVYLLTKRVPPKYAISATNREIVKAADYIVSGVVWQWGGARKACDYARSKNKEIIYVRKQPTEV